MQENPLMEYFENNQGNRIHKWMHYFDIYHRYFNCFRGRKITFLEIGIQNGGSLEMWREYFGPEATIIGVDIMPECKQFESGNTHVRIGDQENPEFWQQIKAEFPSIDLLLDDGGHTVNQQIVTFNEMYSHLNNDGIYLCEDLHTNYWDEFGGGYRKETTFISYMKNLVDDMHSWYSRGDSSFKITAFTKSIKGIHFYDSIVVLEKAIVDAPQDKMTGTTAKIIDNTNLVSTELAKRINEKLVNEKLINEKLINENNELLTRCQTLEDSLEGSLQIQEANTAELIELRSLVNKVRGSWLWKIVRPFRNLLTK